MSPSAVNPAADRLVELILEHAGGSLNRGVCADGSPLPEPGQVQMRTDRFRELTGLQIDDDSMVGYLERLGFQPSIVDGLVTATVPSHRGDISREVDLIEEVVRMNGFDAIEIHDEMRLRPAAMPPFVECHRAVSRVLVGADFVESITHTLVAEQEAGVFLEDGETVLRVEAACAGGDACLRPSVLSSLLCVRRFNLDQGMRSLSLFEWGSIFHREGEERCEQRSLAMLCDAGPDGLRSLRGVLERLATLLCGPDATVEIDPEQSPNWYAPGGRVRFNKTTVGWAGRLSTEVVRNFGLDEPMMAAELHLDDLMKAWPPEFEVRAQPAFPAIERDLSIIVDEAIRWHDVREAVVSLDLPALELVEFVTVYRGKGIDSGRKSMTLRLRFRADDRTLRNEEVDDHVPNVMATLKTRFDAEIRS